MVKPNRTFSLKDAGEMVTNNLRKLFGLATKDGAEVDMTKRRREIFEQQRELEAKKLSKVALSSGSQKKKYINEQLESGAYTKQDHL